MPNCAGVRNADHSKRPDPATRKTCDSMDSTVYTSEHHGHNYSISEDNERDPRRHEWEVGQEHTDPDGRPVEGRRRGHRAFSSRSAQLGFVRRRLAGLSRSGASWVCTGPSVPDKRWLTGRPPQLRHGE